MLTENPASPEAVEELKEQLEVKEEVQHSPADAAAAFFRLEEPRFKLLLEQMSAKQIRRFVMYVGAFPLTDRYKLQNDLEKRAAYLFGQMVFNKSIMQLQFEMERVEQAQKLKETEVQVKDSIVKPNLNHPNLSPPTQVMTLKSERDADKLQDELKQQGGQLTEENLEKGETN